MAALDTGSASVPHCCGEGLEVCRAAWNTASAICPPPGCKGGAAALVENFTVGVPLLQPLGHGRRTAPRRNARRRVLSAYAALGPAGLAAEA